MKAAEPFFEMTIELDGRAAPGFLKYGSICEVRFDRYYDSLGMLAYRSMLRFVNKINLK